jgi:hypothetical protein
MNYEDVEVRTFWRYALCKCGERLEREPNSPAYMTSPPLYLHSCPKCHTRQPLPFQSPQLMTEAVK